MQMVALVGESKWSLLNCRTLDSVASTEIEFDMSEYYSCFFFFFFKYIKLFQEEVVLRKKQSTKAVRFLSNKMIY